MNLRQLSVAYFQYYAIAAYIVVALVSGATVLWSVMSGIAGLWPVLAAMVATVFIYPVVWYVLHRYILHSRWMWKAPMTAELSGSASTTTIVHHSDPSII